MVTLVLYHWNARIRRGHPGHYVDTKCIGFRFLQMGRKQEVTWVINTIVNRTPHKPAIAPATRTLPSE
jgi:hypothetical protein